MKLSQLKDLVAEIENARIEDNPDPDVAFWLSRPAKLPALQGQFEQFIEMDIDASRCLAGRDRMDGTIKTQFRTTATKQVGGEFTFPVLKIDYGNFVIPMIEVTLVNILSITD